MLCVAADVVFGSGYRRRDGASRRQALTWLAAGIWFVGEIIWVILTGVIRVGIGSEPAVDQGGGRVDVHFASFGAAWCKRAFAGLSADVADRSCQGGFNEFGIVFVHDLSVDERQVLGLLGE